MRMLLLMGGLCASLAHAASLPQGYLEFQDYRFTEEHQYGYGVSLWHGNGHLHGVLFMSAALQGDVAAGEIEVQQFNPASGRLRFRVAEGVEKGQPFYCHFDGQLTTRALSGWMRCRYDYRARTTGAARYGAYAVSLPRSKEPMQMANQAEFGAWMVEYLRRNSAVKRFASH